MTLPKRIFFTGVPGSRWSGIAQILEDNVPGFNTTDRTPSRDYSHHAYSGHKGAYFGTDMEFSAHTNHTDQAWEDPDAGCMIVKSHEWAYDLDDIYTYRSYKQGDWIMLVYRPDLPSYAWWHEAGGFKISYPDYSWYRNSTRMLQEIQNQNERILEFGFKHDVQWSHFTESWLQEELGYSYTPDFPYADVLVAMVKP